MSDRRRPVLHLDPRQFLLGRRIQKAKERAPVAHDQSLAVIGQTPAFTAIRERALALERGAVVQKTDAGLPGEFVDGVVHDGDPFAEVLRVHFLELQHLTVFEADLANCRTAVQPGAFVQDTVAIDESLGECLGIVRIDMDHSVAADRCARLAGTLDFRCR